MSHRSLLVLVMPLLLCPSASGEWTRFRGPNGTGVADAKNVPVHITEKDYRWKVALPGKGHSSPIVWKNRLYLTSADETTGQRTLLCLRTSDGSPLWKKNFDGPKHRKHRDNTFASSTPTADENHVYVTWGSPSDYLVVALTHDGKEVWSKDIGHYKSGHGFGPSPIVVGEVVIVPDDHDGPSQLVGLDRRSGKILWQTAREGRSSYITPCILQREGLPPEVIVTTWHLGVTSIDPKTGKALWEANIFDKNHRETAIASPITAGNLVLATCGWMGVRQEVVAVKPPRTPGEKPEKLYVLDRGAPLCNTPIVKGELLFLWDDYGSVTCADLATGKVHWRKRLHRGFYSSPICLGDRLYNISRNGRIVVLAIDKEYRLLAQSELGEGTHSTPAIADGVLYIRTFSHLIAVGGDANP